MSSETDYVSRQGDKAEIPVQADDVRVEDPIDENTADTDAQLGKHMSSRKCYIDNLLTLSRT